jgi:hypothetical protein
MTEVEREPVAVRSGAARYQGINAKVREAASAAISGLTCPHGEAVTATTPTTRLGRSLGFEPAAHCVDGSILAWEAMAQAIAKLGVNISHDWPYP